MKSRTPIRMLYLLPFVVWLFPAPAFADCSEKLLNRLLDSGFSKTEILELCGTRSVPRKFSKSPRSSAAACRGLKMLKEQIERAYDDCREYNDERWDEWEEERRDRRGPRDPWRMPPMDLSCGDYTANLDRIEEQIDKFCD